MLVVHGIWAYGALQLWAEDPALPARAPARAGRPSRAPRPHPFAVPAAELADALGRVNWARVVCDEAQTLDTRTAETALRTELALFPVLAEWCPALRRAATRVWTTTAAEVC
jgi:hypothetical protein